MTPAESRPRMFGTTAACACAAVLSSPARHWPNLGNSASCEPSDAGGGVRGRSRQEGCEP